MSEEPIFGVGHRVKTNKDRSIYGFVNSLFQSLRNSLLLKQFHSFLKFLGNYVLVRTARTMTINNPYIRSASGPKAANSGIYILGYLDPAEFFELRVSVADLMPVVDPRNSFYIVHNHNLKILSSLLISFFIHQSHQSSENIRNIRI